MRELIAHYGPLRISRRSADYTGLVRIIINQQLSNKAAGTIFSRLISIVGRDSLTPEAVLGIKESDFRSIGISAAKTSYIRGLASILEERPDFLKRLADIENDEAFKILTSVKGIGPWSASIFLMFNLGREDIYPEGDVSINKAIKCLYEIHPDKHQTVSEGWRPHRTLACLYLWKWIDVKNKK